MCSNFRAHAEILNRSGEQIQNTFHVFKCNRLKPPEERIKHFIAFFGNIYPDICSIFVYKHNPEPTQTWTK